MNNCPKCKKSDEVVTRPDGTKYCLDCGERVAERPSDATACSAGSMLRCYWAFIEYYPWKKSEFPTYDLWICSDADDARIFRQGWAARSRALESLPNA